MNLILIKVAGKKAFRTSKDVSVFITSEMILKGIGNNLQFNHALHATWAEMESLGLTIARVRGFESYILQLSSVQG